MTGYSRGGRWYDLLWRFLAARDECNDVVVYRATVLVFSAGLAVASVVLLCLAVAAGAGELMLAGTAASCALWAVAPVYMLATVSFEPWMASAQVVVAVVAVCLVDVHEGAGNRGSAAWPMLLAVIQYAGMCAPQGTTAYACAVACVWAVMTSCERHFRFGLYDIAGTPAVDTRGGLGECMNPPCPQPLLEGPVITCITQLATILGVTFLTCVNRGSAERSVAMMATSTDIIQVVAVCLAYFDTTTATEVLDAYEGVVPPAFRTVLEDLIHNLTAYRRYLPSTCRPTSMHGGLIEVNLHVGARDHPLTVEPTLGEALGRCNACTYVEREDTHSPRTHVEEYLFDTVFQDGGAGGATLVDGRKLPESIPESEPRPASAREVTDGTTRSESELWTRSEDISSSNSERERPKFELDGNVTPLFPVPADLDVEVRVTSPLEPRADLHHAILVRLQHQALPRVSSETGLPISMPTSAGSADGDRGAGPPAPQRPRAVLQKQWATLVQVQLRGVLGHLEAGGLEGVAEVFAERTLVEIKHSRGAVDGFLGDKVLASFNASRRCASHEGSALRAAHQLSRAPDATAQVSIAIVTGQVQCADLGCERQRTAAVMGRPAMEVRALAQRMHDLGDTRVVCNKVCAKAGAFMYDMRLVLRRVRSVYEGSPCDTRHMVYELMGQVPCSAGNEGEWMYTLERRSARRVWDVYNDVGEGVLLDTSTADAAAAMLEQNGPIMAPTAATRLQEQLQLLKQLPDVVLHLA